MKEQIVAILTGIHELLNQGRFELSVPQIEAAASRLAQYRAIVTSIQTDSLVVVEMPAGEDAYATEEG